MPVLAFSVGGTVVQVEPSLTASAALSARVVLRTIIPALWMMDSALVGFAGAPSVLRAMYTRRHWPVALQREFKAMTPVVARLACAEDPWPERSGPRMLSACIVDPSLLGHVVSLVVAAVNSGDPTELRNFERSRRIELAHARDAIPTPLDVEQMANLLARLRRVDDPERRNDARVKALLDVMASFTLRPREVSA
jgi:hypothetical protein